MLCFSSFSLGALCFPSHLPSARRLQGGEGEGAVEEAVDGDMVVGATRL